MKNGASPHIFAMHPVSTGCILAGSLVLISGMVVWANGLDDMSEPSATDPSAYSYLPDNLRAALDNLHALPKANQGALELPYGVYGNKQTPLANNVLPPALQTSYNYPTNGHPSPLFGAQPFTQKMMLFEEFGVERLDREQADFSQTQPLPMPRLGALPEQDPSSVARSAPRGSELDAFLQQPGIAPYPTQYANTMATNPWQDRIEQFLNRFLVSPPAEGRPPGKGWSHQRWNEFYPQVYFKTVQTGARVNGGVRDSRQMHGYQVGEFAPGGLYHNTAGMPQTEGTTEGISVRLHPRMPVQTHKSVWTFDGTFPPKLLMVRYGQGVLMRHYNALPIDPAANNGFGLHTLTTHEHNGHNPAESDGFANAFFFPGQFYDYRWPIQLAGYDSINTTATDARAAFPCAPGEELWVNDSQPGMRSCQNGSIKIRGDWRETMGTHWFHDHMLDFTALPWGNRDYDVNLVVADKAWDKNGQLWFNPFNTDGFIGDQLITNWQYKPYLDVRARRYRFRILNGSISRYLTIAVVREVKGEKAGEMRGPKNSGVSYNRVPFHMVANDGNIMEHAVPFDGSMDLDNTTDINHRGQLPTQAVAERYDIVIDFAKHGIKPGDKLYFVNVKEHDTGERSKRDIPLAQVLSGDYRIELKQTSTGPKWDKGDPVVGKFLELRVKAYSGTDFSMNPVEYEPAKPGKAKGKTMIPLWLDRNNATEMAKLQGVRQRAFKFGRSDGTDEEPWTIKVDEGYGYSADPRRIGAAVQLATGPTSAGFSGDGTLEVWKIENGGNGWGHPVHVHFEEGIILSRGDVPPPEWEKWARKDVYRVGPEEDSKDNVRVAIRFREFAGTYLEHCHNTQHEDNSMLLRWDIERPGQFTLMPTPLPTWEGVGYVNSAALPGFRTGRR